jgi:hypothetical protein
MRMFLKIVCFIALAVAVTTGCKTHKDLFVEPVKDLNSQWRIQTVLRNGTDITEYIDSAGFRLTLLPDNTYTLQGNNIPFLVNGSGKWSVDDPQYPYHIVFTPTDSTSSFAGSVATPVSKGSRRLDITFSPGCRQNTYLYSFEKMN